jgi:hypothetical protein
MDSKSKAVTRWVVIRRAGDLRARPPRRAHRRRHQDHDPRAATRTRRHQLGDTTVSDMSNKTNDTGGAPRCAS